MDLLGPWAEGVGRCPRWDWSGQLRLISALWAPRVGELPISSLILVSVSNKVQEVLGMRTGTQLDPDYLLLFWPLLLFYFNRWVIHHPAGLLGTCWVWPTPSPRTAQASSRGLNLGSGLCSLSSLSCCSPALSCASHTEWWSRKTASITGTAVFLMTTDSYSGTRYSCQRAVNRVHTEITQV